MARPNVAYSQCEGRSPSLPRASPTYGFFFCGGGGGVVGGSVTRPRSVVAGPGRGPSNWRWFLVMGIGFILTMMPVCLSITCCWFHGVVEGGNTGDRVRSCAGVPIVPLRSGGSGSAMPDAHLGDSAPVAQARLADVDQPLRPSR